MSLTCPECGDAETTLIFYEMDGRRITGHMTCEFGHEFDGIISEDNHPKYIDADLAADLGVEA